MKKEPAKKKSAPTPKRKYQRRKNIDEPRGGADQSINGSISLFQLEKVDLVEYMARRNGHSIDQEKEKMEEILKQIKVGEAFNIKRSWVKYLREIIDVNKLKIIVRTFPIAGNEKFRKVVRMN